MATKCLFKTLCHIYPHRSQKKGKLKGFHLNGDQNTLPNLSISTEVTKELKFGRLSPEWRPGTFSKYSTIFIYFHKGKKRTEIFKAFTWMANKCLLKILYKIFCFHRGLKRKENWKSFILMATKCLFKILNQIHLFTHRPQKTKIERLSPEWRPKYSTKCIYFHRGHKGTEIWKAFTWMATKCIFKILYQIYLFPHRPQKK